MCGLELMPSVWSRMWMFRIGKMASGTYAVVDDDIDVFLNRLDHNHLHRYAFQRGFSDIKTFLAA